MESAWQTLNKTSLFATSVHTAQRAHSARLTWALCRLKALSDFPLLKRRGARRLAGLSVVLSED